MTKHNKKRNVGLVYEMLLQYITENLINENQKAAKKAIKLIERRFDKSKELYKEFRLFNALISSTVSGTHIAASILSEAKEASKRFNEKQLDREKSLLIKDINHILKDNNFFHRRVKEYKMYATIQTLLNEWRKKDMSNLAKVINYESQVVEWLIDDKKVVQNKELISENNSDKLVLNLMAKKINHKYNKTLSDEQKLIIKNYAFLQEDHEKLKSYLSNIKRKTLTELNEFKKNCENDVLLEKFDLVFEKIHNLPEIAIDDSIVTQYLVISNLKQSIIGE